MVQLLHLVLRRLVDEGDEGGAHAWYRQVANAAAADVLANLSFTNNPLHLATLMALLLNGPVRVVKVSPYVSMSCDTSRGKHTSSRQLVDIVPPCGEHWLASVPKYMQPPQALTELLIAKCAPCILPPKLIIIHQLHHGAYVTQPQPQLLTMELTGVAGRWRFDVVSYAPCEVVSRHLRRRLVYHARAIPGACSGCRVGLVHGSCTGVFCGFGLCRHCQTTQWRYVSSTPDAAAVCAMVGWLCKTCVSPGRDINMNAYIKPPQGRHFGGRLREEEAQGICQVIMNAWYGQRRVLVWVHARHITKSARCWCCTKATCTRRPTHVPSIVHLFIYSFVQSNARILRVSWLDVGNLECGFDGCESRSVVCARCMLWFVKASVLQGPLTGCGRSVRIERCTIVCSQVKCSSCNSRSLLCLEGFRVTGLGVMVNMGHVRHLVHD